MDDLTLKSCPFCGGPGSRVDANSAGDTFAGCAPCDVWADDDAAWNRRVLAALDTARLDWLEQDRREPDLNSDGWLVHENGVIVSRRTDHATLRAAIDDAMSAPDTARTEPTCSCGFGAGQGERFPDCPIHGDTARTEPAEQEPS